MRRSTRARITLTAVIVMAVAVGIASFILVALLRHSLLRNVDARAKLRLQDLVTLVEHDQIPIQLAGNDEDGTVAQLVAGSHVVAQSPIVRGTQPLADFVPKGNDIEIRTVRNPPIIDGAPEYRVAATRVTTSSGPMVIYAAASTEPVNDSINSVEALLGVTAPALVILVGAMTWWFVGRTLGAVETIRRQVAELSASDLDRRVPEPETNDEIRLLARTMNAMLARFEDAVRRQQVFVSDAAHELRSPVAAIRAELDVATAHRQADNWPAAVDRLGRSTRRIERLVEDLLLLATSDEQRPRRRADVDLDEIVIRQVESLRATSSRHVDVHRLDAARVWGDPEQLERVVTNLLDNAEQHAASSIGVELRTVDGMAELVVADDGPGIPPEDRERIFDRFTRLDEARDRRHGGTGLGLAIVQQVADDHGGAIKLADTTVGAHLVLRLPLHETVARSTAP